MTFNLEDALALLSRTPHVLDVQLKNLPESWTHQNEGEETWSVYDVVGHLIHGEKDDWITRTNIILDGGKKNFTPFDRFAQFENSKGKTLPELLSEFTQLRQENIVKLKAMNITQDDFAKEGVHPDFGTVTLEQLLSTWVVHDLSHLAQIDRIMARQYMDEVGPWKKYLGILHS